jgi:hypothetical protein
MRISPILLIYYYFFSEFVYRHMVVACGAPFTMGFVNFFFLNLCMGCRMCSSIWGEICLILFIYYFFF